MTWSAASASTRPFVLNEVQAAVRALDAGEFRHCHPTAQPGTHTNRNGHSRRHGSVDVGSWTPRRGERVIAVIGSAGSMGASTVALAIAMSATGPARVLECCSASASGLAAASTAELGLHPSGWRQGKRDQVLIERTSEVLAGVGEVPAPTTAEHSVQLTVLDIGWEIGHLVATDSWVTDALVGAGQIVVVTTATIPGMRRLDGTLELLSTQASLRPQTNPAAHEMGDMLTHRTWVAVLGPRRKKWPRGIEHAGGPASRRVLASDRVVEIPEDRGLAVDGLDSRPIASTVLSAAARIHTSRASAPADPGRHVDDDGHDLPGLLDQTD